jgi:hypothetical protein
LPINQISLVRFSVFAHGLPKPRKPPKPHTIINLFKKTVERFRERSAACNLLVTLSAHSLIRRFILLILFQNRPKAIPLGFRCVTPHSAESSHQNGDTVFIKQILTIPSKNGFGTPVGSVYRIKLGNLVRNSSVEIFSRGPPLLQPE